MRSAHLKCFSLRVYFLFNFLYFLVYFLIILFKLLFLFFFFNLKFKDMHSSNSHLLYYYTYYFLFLFAHPFSSIMHTLYFVVFVFSVLLSQSRVVAELRADLNWLPRRFGMNSNQTTNQQNTKLAKTATDGCDDGKSQRRLRYIFFLDFLRPLAVYALLVYKHTQPHTHTCAHTLKSVWSQSRTQHFFFYRSELMFMWCCWCCRLFCCFNVWLFYFCCCFVVFLDFFYLELCWWLRGVYLSGCAVLFTCPLASKQAVDDPLLHTLLYM